MLDNKIAYIRALLLLEQTDKPPHNWERLNTSNSRRENIKKLLHEIEETVSPLHKSLGLLPPIQELTEVLWAQSVLAMPNVVFLEIDVTGSNETAQILRWVVVDVHSNLISEADIKPEKLFPTVIESVTNNGMMVEHAEMFHGLFPAYNQLGGALFGKYVIYFSDFTRTFFRTIAEHYEMSPLVFIGADLQSHASCYYHKFQGLNLFQLCEHLCDPLPKDATAVARARAQLDILKAMSRVLIDARQI